MPRNGVGTFVPVATSFNPAVAGTTIDGGAGGFETTLADLAAGLTQSLSKDGQTEWTGDQNASGSFKITNMANGTAATDSATLGQVQAAGGSFVSAGGVTGTADAILLAPSPAISAYAAGQEFWFVAEGTNTVAVTVAVSGLAAKAVQANAAALVAGDIVNTRLVGIKYDGTAFQLIASRAVVSHTADYADASVTLAKLAADAYTASTFVPVLSFGGASVGITYGTQSGAYYRIGNLVLFTVHIVLTSKGSSTGSAAITGLPVAASGGWIVNYTVSGGGTLKNVPQANLNAGTSGASTIYLASVDGTGGFSALADTNFSNITNIYVSGSYGA